MLEGKDRRPTHPSDRNLFENPGPSSRQLDSMYSNPLGLFQSSRTSHLSPSTMDDSYVRSPPFISSALLDSFAAAAGTTARW
jgi:hypothetical protein